MPYTHKEVSLDYEVRKEVLACKSPSVVALVDKARRHVLVHVQQEGLLFLY